MEIRTLVRAASGLAAHVVRQLSIAALLLGGVATAHAAVGPGTILITDATGGTGLKGSLVAVDTSTLRRTIVSDFGNEAQGPLGDYPTGVAITRGLLGIPLGILVVDSSAGTNQQGAVFLVDPKNGVRTIWSDFGNPQQGPVGQSPSSIFVQLNSLGVTTAIYVVDSDAGPKQLGKLFRLDANGRRTLVQDFGDAQGNVNQITYFGGVAVP